MQLLHAIKKAILIYLSVNICLSRQTESYAVSRSKTALGIP